MRNTAFVAVGIGCLILQANLFRLLDVFGRLVLAFTSWLSGVGASAMVPTVTTLASMIVTPNLVLPLIIFTGVHEYSLPRGAALAFILGYAFDLFAAAPVGLFTFVSVTSFLVARIAGVRLAAQTVLTQLALAFLFALLQGVSVMVLIAIFHRDPYVAKAMLPRLLPATISTAIFAPFVFRLAARIHQMTITVPRPGEGPAR